MNSTGENEAMSAGIEQQISDLIAAHSLSNVVLQVSVRTGRSCWQRQDGERRRYLELAPVPGEQDMYQVTWGSFGPPGRNSMDSKRFGPARHVLHVFEQWMIDQCPWSDVDIWNPDPVGTE